VQWQRAPYNGGFGSPQSPPAWQQTTQTTVTLTGLTPGYEYCFSTRARDRAGNLGGYATARCIARPLDDKSLAKTSAWTRKTDSRYYLNTVTTTTTHGAKLTRTGVRANQLELLVTKCSSCGSITVSFAGFTQSWSLKARKTKRRAALATAPFSYRTGTLTITVTSSSGKLVEIDGLGVRRT
jgi:hypothetical protein